MNVPCITIEMCERDLQKRFAPFSPDAQQVREAMDVMLEEATSWGKPAVVAGALRTYARLFIKAPMRQEMKAIAALIGLPYHHLIMANAYWDGVCFLFKTSDPLADLLDMIRRRVSPVGCTAFAYNTPEGPVHARNMDWAYVGHIAGLTAVIEYRARLRKNSFKTVSLPGLSAIISGMKPGCFSVTLNAVTSEEKGLGQPAGLLIRNVLAEARSFDEAVRMLTEEPILSDCLLLVTGINNGEMVVIDRTPTQGLIRYPEGDFIVATNGYLKYRGQARGPGGEIQSTSCGRFRRTSELLAGGLPEEPGDAFDILNAEGVFMPVTTVQQMVMCPATGFMDARVPEKKGAG